MMRVLGVIPARLGSTRLPNKPLQLLAGEPLITRVIQRVMEHGLIDRLVVATDAPMVVEVVERSGVRAVMTDAGHPTGTDRVAEAARQGQRAAMHSGLTIGVSRLAQPARPGVDTPDDLRRAEAHWHALEG